MTEPAASPDPSAGRRDRRVYVWWVVGLGGLALTGLLCWLALPVLRAHEVLGDVQQRTITRVAPCAQELQIRQEAVGQLGGQQEAAAALSVYVRLPKQMAPRRFAAVILLGHCGRFGVAALIAMLGDADGVNRNYALQSLDRIGPEANPAIPAIVQALRDPSHAIRISAARALGSIGPAHAADSLPALVKAIDDPYVHVRQAAIEALGKLGPAAAEVAPRLEKMCGNAGTGGWIQQTALDSLMKIRGQEPPK